MDRPSILGSQAKAISASGLRSVSRSSPRRTRSKKPCSSSSVKALSSDSIGLTWRTLANAVVGVGNLRRILLVIELVVMADFLGQPLVLGARLALGHLVDAELGLDLVGPG